MPLRIQAPGILFSLLFAKPPTNLDGISILPVLRDGAALPERTLFWSVGKGTAARRGPWKLVIEHGSENKNGTFYHLGDDPAEKSPATNHGIQKQLKTELDAWLKSWADVPQHS